MLKVAKFLKTSELVTPSSEAGTMSLWHGGNLDNLESFTTQKKGRYEYGSGLYLTTHYGTAAKYSKGSRRLWLVTISKGNDGKTANLNMENVKTFVSNHIVKKKQPEILQRMEKYNKGGQISFDIFNNILLNEDVLKPSETENLRRFIVDNGIDYISVSNAFGWGETMIVLFNLKKIISKQVIKPKDKIEIFDLPTDFN